VSTFSQHRHPARGMLAAGVVVIALAATGCQTPQQATVAPPATGMIGQPAAYGSWATPPQGAAYPPTVSAPPMPGTAPSMPTPGPATQWQSAAPPPGTPPAAAPTGSTWSWSQPPAGAPPSAQQYANQLQGQTQQYANQMQGQTQQYANQMQAQAQQYANQAQGYANQQVQQYAPPAVQQQVTAQMPTYTQAPPTTTSAWNPFNVPAQSLPPARATPTTTVPRY